MRKERHFPVPGAGSSRGGLSGVLLQKQTARVSQQHFHHPMKHPSEHRRGADVVECLNTVFLQRSASADRNNPEFSGIFVRVGEQHFNEFAVSGLEYMQWHDQPRHQNGVEGEEWQHGKHMGSVNCAT